MVRQGQFLALVGTAAAVIEMAINLLCGWKILAPLVAWLVLATTAVMAGQRQISQKYLTLAIGISRGQWALTAIGAYELKTQSLDLWWRPCRA